MKKKRKFMTAKEITRHVGGTPQTTNRKLKKLTPKLVETKMIKVKYGNWFRPVTHYRVRKK